MINAQMKLYNYFTFGNDNEYGQPQLSKEPVGKIKIAIYITTQNIQDNINYKEARYIGLTQNAEVNDTYVIEYEGQKLKVLYIQPNGRYKQVFLGDM